MDMEWVSRILFNFFYLLFHSLDFHLLTKANNFYLGFSELFMWEICISMQHIYINTLKKFFICLIFPNYFLIVHISSEHLNCYFCSS